MGKYIKYPERYKFVDGEWWYYYPKTGSSLKSGNHTRERAETLRNRFDKVMTVNGKYISRSHPLHKAGNYKTFEGAAFSALKGYEKTPEGYVYIIANPSFDGWLKVGMAIDAEDRCNGYQTSSPHRDYKLLYSRRFNDRRTAETKTLHKLKKVVKEHNGEWFKTDRNTAQEIIEEFAKFSSVPVINALTNEEHPCQALADLLTLYERVGTLKGFSLAFVGDGNNVASSLVVTAASLGLDVRLATPKGYLPSDRVLSEADLRAKESGGRFFVTDRPEKAVAGAQAVYTDTWVSMGQEREAEQRRIAFKDYQVNKELLELADSTVLVMHDLPAHRGEEITDEVFEGENSIIFEQAENRTWAQAAVVAFLLGAI